MSEIERVFQQYYVVTDSRLQIPRHIQMDSQVEDTQPDLENEIDASAVFVPPSIHHDDLISSQSYAHYTAIPQLVKTSVSPSTTGESDVCGTECVLGVDEAGRGPVLGPMIYGAFYLPTELHHSLLATTHHFDDSKVLTPAVRANLMKAVCTRGSDLHNSCGWAIKSLSARDIGAGMLRNNGSYNLNAQAMDATIEIVKGVIGQGVNVVEIYVDTIGSPIVYQKRLEKVFPTIKIRVEKKADSLFPCVSAASVVAKVTRDVSCELLYEEYAKHGEAVNAAPGWGSGYPSDARCVRWLKSEMEPLFGWGGECRFSWGTVKDMMELKENGGTRIDWPDGGDGDDMRVSDFFVGGAMGQKRLGDGDQLRTWFGTRVEQEAFS
jgi:ribonuclease H2 subunit A